MSLTPLDLQTAFHSIKKSRVPDAAYRGHIFENSMRALVEWWAYVFFRVQKTGHIRSHTYEEIQQLLKSDDYEFDENYQLAYASLEDHEIVKTPKSLMKHALMRSGSRDVSAQLFTALCRALGIPARLVVSLQSVPWQANAGKSKPGKKKPKTDTPADSDDDMEEVSVPAVRDIKGKGRAIDSDGGYVVSEGSRSSTAGSPSTNGKGKGKQRATPAVRLRKTRPKPPPQESLEGSVQVPLYRLTHNPMHSQMIQTWRPPLRQCGQKFSRVQIAAGYPSIQYKPSSTSARYLTLLSQTSQRKERMSVTECST